MTGVNPNRFNAANEAKLRKKQMRMVRENAALFEQPRANQPPSFRRTPLGLEYWIATLQGRMPVGPYCTPSQALANGRSLNLRGLWWVEAEAGDD